MVKVDVIVKFISFTLDLLWIEFISHHLNNNNHQRASEVYHFAY